ncbi:hypothetical protein BFL43_09255 [Williamsia sp. 1135]|nr:hypothetical protein BFL43_09255 [Williamsia sp. 1135]
MWLSEEERAVIERAAAQMELTPMAFVAAAGVRAAKAATGSETAVTEKGSAAVPLDVAQARELLDEVRRLRRLMGNVAGNLNDVARHANSTGQLAPETAAVLDFVRRTNERTDAELMGLLRRLR